MGSKRYLVCRKVISSFLLVVLVFPCLYHINADESKLLTGIVWSQCVKETDGSYSHSAFVVDNDRIYGSTGSTYFCIDALSGNIVWSRHDLMSLRPRIYHYGDFIYVFGIKIMGISKANGMCVWIKDCDEIISCFQVENNLYYSTKTRKLIKFNLETGLMDKTWILEKELSSVKVKGEEVIGFTDESILIKYNLSSKKIIWKQKLKTQKIGDCLWYDGKIFIECGSLVSLNDADGSVVWENDEVDETGNLNVSGDRLISGESCLDKHTGKVLWTNRSNISYSIVVGKYVYCYDSDWLIYNLETGNAVYKRKSNMYLFRESLAATVPLFCNGSIYISSYDGKIYKYGVPAESVEIMDREKEIMVGNQCVDLNVSTFTDNGKLFVEASKVLEPLGFRMYKKSWNCWYVCRGKNVIASIVEPNFRALEIVSGYIFTGRSVNDFPMICMSEFADVFNLDVSKKDNSLVISRTKN